MKKEINFKQEMADAKLKMIENGITIKLMNGVQLIPMDYSKITLMSKDFLVRNLRHFSDAFTQFEDPGVPELVQSGPLTRKEVYFILRSAYIAHVAKENAKEIARIDKELDSFKTRKEKRQELLEKKDALANG